MKHRKAGAAILAIAAFGLTGCPMDIASMPGLDLRPYTPIGIPTQQQIGAGDPLPGTKTDPSGGGSSGGRVKPGSDDQRLGPLPGTGGTFGASGKTPSQVSLPPATSLRVDALFPNATLANVAIGNATRGMLTVSSVPAKLANGNLLMPSLNVSWPSGPAFLAPAVAPRPADGKMDFKRQLRKELGQRSFTDIRGNYAPQALAKDSEVYIKVGDVYELRKLKIYPTQTATFDNRVTSFAIAVDTDDQAIFDSGQGPVRRTTLQTHIRERIIPQLQNLYGPIPTQSEAKQQGINFRDDLVYFIFSSKLPSNLLGYFAPGDFLPGGTSNQIKALYLNASMFTREGNEDLKRQDVLGTIAHELQHLIYAWSRSRAVGSEIFFKEAFSGKNAWIDEGLAMLATAVAGYGLEPLPAGQPLMPNVPPYAGPSRNQVLHVENFLAAPSAYSLLAFYEGATIDGETGMGNPTSAYGMAYLFAQYMVDQVGKDVIKDITGSTKSGFRRTATEIVGETDPTGIVSDALERRNVKLGTLFANFATALALDGTEALANSEAALKTRYDIQGVTLRNRVVAGVSLQGPKVATRLDTAPRPYGIQILEPGPLRDPSALQLKGNSSVSSRLILYR